MNRLLNILANDGSQPDNSDSTNQLIEAMKNMTKSPVFYIVIGIVVLLLILIYLLKRIIKARPNAKIIIVRKGKIFRIIDNSNPRYFLIPFIDHVGAVVTLDEKELNSDKLYINNGPDILYKINYTLTYIVDDIHTFYKFKNGIQNTLVFDINKSLREYADDGNANTLVKEYREHLSDILALINRVTSKYGVLSISLRINYIEPISR